MIMDSHAFISAINFSMSYKLLCDTREGRKPMKKQVRKQREGSISIKPYAMFTRTLFN